MEDIHLHPLEKIILDLSLRAFEIRILDYKGKNWKFGVRKLHCKINIKRTKMKVKNGRITIRLRKLDKDDHWFSLFY